MSARDRLTVGELRPSQMLFSFGIGAVVDLPHVSVVPLGLDDWPPSRGETVPEDRLVALLRQRLGQQLTHLIPFPRPTPTEAEQGASIGVPVVAFPGWSVCSACRLLWPNDQFQLEAPRNRPDRIAYRHLYCDKARGDGRRQSSPLAHPVRFVVACRAGHLDDFPWLHFVHRGPPCATPVLRLRDRGPSGEARDVRVECSCGVASRSMAEAFGSGAAGELGPCSGRRVHLHDAQQGCQEPLRTVLAGASNLWFPVTLSALSLPSDEEEVDRVVAEQWPNLEPIQTRSELEVLLRLPAFQRLARFGASEVWRAIEQRRQPADVGTGQEDVLLPEWHVLSNPRPSQRSRDFESRQVDLPRGWDQWLERVVLVERLREVKALTGFTRIESLVDAAEDDEEAGATAVAPLSRHRPRVLPAVETRGEGVFLQLREEAVASWLDRSPVAELATGFVAANREWRRRREIAPVDGGFRGMRFVLLHSLAHAIGRQLAMDCGYPMAALRERIYCRGANEPGGPMAGILLYTAASDSEGTLGGLVHLGEPRELGPHLDAAIASARLCSSDPLCAEAAPNVARERVNGASCHACLFSAETFCQAGNRFLDRSSLVRTVARGDAAFFEPGVDH